MITIKSKGDWKKTTRYFTNAKNLRVEEILKRHGEIGVDALYLNTPKLTGTTAMSWEYTIRKTGGGYALEWSNSNVINGSVIALLIQYGHGTGTGGYIPPRDYINPALKPIFDKIAEDIWKEVTSL